MKGRLAPSAVKYGAPALAFARYCCQSGSVTTRKRLRPSSTVSQNGKNELSTCKALREPAPPTIEDKRALDSVLRNPRRDAALLFDVKILRVKK